MDLHLTVAFADLASPSEQPRDYLATAHCGLDGLTIAQHRQLLPSQWNTSEPRDQRFPAVAFDGDLQALSRAATGGHGRLVLV
ncbi:hypothetical protein [Nocardia miyunensis]|uniref:hypothetical protein n=1 Tax=Nocardia miyunensis TaxID=282684 RepID=UPI0012F4BDEF|nr:hypothetical protein [Nocardia miyunensis]